MSTCSRQALLTNILRNLSNYRQERMSTYSLQAQLTNILRNMEQLQAGENVHL